VGESGREWERVGESGREWEMERAASPAWASAPIPRPQERGITLKKICGILKL
jgi:hypothetical protein